MKHFLMTAALVLISAPACATTVSSTVSKVMLDQNNGVRAFVKPAAAMAAAGCRANVDWPFVIDISTDYGKRLYAAVLTAYTASRPVVLKGTNACDLHPGVETLNAADFN